MRFWDTSALVPLVIQEQTSPVMASLFRRDPRIVLWWGTSIESVGALARSERLEELDPESVSRGLQLLWILREGALEIQPSEELRLRAMRLLSVHPLRTADALQLASALIWCHEQTSGREFVCQDRRLRDAAFREGFAVLPEAR